MFWSHEYRDPREAGSSPRGQARPPHHISRRQRYWSDAYSEPIAFYQFYMASEEDCKAAMESARNRIADDTELHNNITKLITAAQPKMNATHGVIYVTGYAGFFGIDDNTCDNVTWAVWRDVKSGGQYLKLAMRKDLNKMVRSVNDVIRHAVEDSGPNVPLHRLRQTHRARPRPILRIRDP